MAVRRGFWVECDGCGRNVEPGASTLLGSPELAVADAEGQYGWAQARGRLLCPQCQPDPAAAGVDELASWEQRIEEALWAMFDGDAAEMTTSEAYGALVYRLRQHCEATGDQPAQVLDELGENALRFARHADDPAAFLAARVRDL